MDFAISLAFMLLQRANQRAPRRTLTNRNCALQCVTNQNIACLQDSEFELTEAPKRHKKDTQAVGRETLEQKEQMESSIEILPHIEILAECRALLFYYASDIQRWIPSRERVYSRIQLVCQGLSSGKMYRLHGRLETSGEVSL